MTPRPLDELTAELDKVIRDAADANPARTIKLFHSQTGMPVKTAEIIVHELQRTAGRVTQMVEMADVLAQIEKKRKRP